MDGTSLEDAFGMFQAPIEQPQVVQRKSTPVQQLQQLQTDEASTRSLTDPHMPQQPLTQQAQQLQPQSRHVYAPKDAHAAIQQVVPVQYPSQLQTQKYSSYFDAMVNKKRDVLKMVSFAVIILLAISIHTVADFSLKEIIMSNDFTFKQEVGVRLVYPLAVVFLLWNIKALTGTR